MRIWVIVALLLTVLDVRAVIVYGGDGSQNGTVPSIENGWSYVGTVDSQSSPCSVTYLSQNWFITANHVWQNEIVGKEIEQIQLGGTVYQVNTQTSVQLVSPDGSNADLRLFQTKSTVQGINAVRIASSSYEAGTEVTMIGHGMNRNTEITNFGGTSVYYWGSYGSNMRWGKNKIEPYGTTCSDTECFQTDFDGLTDEAQATTFDSGGGVFVGEGDQLELAGIMIGGAWYTSASGKNVSVLDGSLDGYSASRTYIADLSVYQPQIDLAMSSPTAIPEPSVSFLIMGSFVGVVFIRRVFLI